MVAVLRTDCSAGREAAGSVRNNLVEKLRGDGGSGQGDRNKGGELLASDVLRGQSQRLFPMHWVWDAKEGEQQGQPSTSPPGLARDVPAGAACMGGVQHVSRGKTGSRLQTSEGLLLTPLIMSPLS